MTKRDFFVQSTKYQYFKLINLILTEDVHYQYFNLFIILNPLSLMNMILCAIFLTAIYVWILN